MWSQLTNRHLVILARHNESMNDDKNDEIIAAVCYQLHPNLPEFSHKRN